jgi:hypothetical protein
MATSEYLILAIITYAQQGQNRDELDMRFSHQRYSGLHDAAADGYELVHVVPRAGELPVAILRRDRAGDR